MSRVKEIEVPSLRKSIAYAFASAPGLLGEKQKKLMEIFRKRIRWLN